MKNVRPPADETQTVHYGPEADDHGPSDLGSDDHFVFRRGVCLGRYVVLRAIGSGGMGNVYAAYDPELDRNVALKVLSADVLTSARREEAQARLLREAQATAKLAHPNVVAVFDTGTVGERLFIAMELIEGVTLTEWLHAAARSRHDILAVFEQAGRGLAAAHRVGLVHRDFKPGNVMVGDDGRARVLDFGLARASGWARPGAAEGREVGLEGRACDSLLALPLTVEGSVLGTPAYMAPEQGMGTVADARADQFSYCLALYEALYGELPFEGETTPELRRNAQDGKVKEAPAGSAVPGWLRRILLRGLDPDPAARFPTMDELLAALAEDPAIRRRRAMLAALAFAALTAAVAAYSHLEGRRELLCKGAERKLAGIWDPPRKAVLREAFLETGMVDAEDTWRRVEASLDGRASAWVALHTEVCEATRRRGEQSEEMLDCQMACLQTRLQEIGALSEVFARADAQVVENAVRAADSLTGLEGCTDRRALIVGVEPPRDAATAARVEQLRARLAEAKVLAAVGKYAEELQIAREVARAADELGYRPLIAEARYELGRVQGRLRNLAEMRASLLAAASAAQASRHDEILARSLSVLIVSARLRGQLEEGRLMAELARGAIERLGNREDLVSTWRSFLGGLAFAEGQYEEALAHYEAALERYEAAIAGDRGTDGFNQAAMLTNLGAIHMRLGHFDAAVETSHRALLILEEHLGPDHRQLMSPLLNLGELWALEGDFETALPFFERALAVIERAGNPDDLDAAFGLTGVGLSLIELDRAEAAVVLLERAVRIRASAPVDPALLAESRFQLARALVASSLDALRARDLAGEARQTLADLGERGERELGRVDAWLHQQGWQP